ncbi:hypothetical protein SDC9_144574 [bioreactor metagenome]|uniref:Uncharacterized protein n=1 Tax=bioreactor metagenome TaxID=1076179 RepID=A0A645E760_9ZZZZ
MAQKADISAQSVDLINRARRSFQRIGIAGRINRGREIDRNRNPMDLPSVFVFAIENQLPGGFRDDPVAEIHVVAVHGKAENSPRRRAEVEIFRQNPGERLRRGVRVGVDCPAPAYRLREVQHLALFAVDRHPALFVVRKLELGNHNRPGRPGHLRFGIVVVVDIEHITSTLQGCVCQ